VETIPLSPLGKATVYPQRYDPALLYPVERAPQRAEIGVADDALPFAGLDRWTAWELFWLDGEGRAQVGIATFEVPCTSARIVESKSVKLWLTSMNAHGFASVADVEAAMSRELSSATGAAVAVQVAPPGQWARFARAQAAGRSIDAFPLWGLPDSPDPTCLAAAPSGSRARETLVTHAFRSVCPVTGQPDYASVMVDYEGPAIDPASLATYLAGFRRHPGFHEGCVEQIFVDLLRACAPARLSVEARFTRRGGIDINPVRTTDGTVPPPSPPNPRQ